MKYILCTFLCFLTLHCTHAQSATPQRPQISTSGTAVALYKGDEYGDGYWLLFGQGNKPLALFSPHMVLEELKGQEGTSVQVHYSHELIFHPAVQDYVVTKLVKHVQILPNINEQQLQAMKEKLLAKKGPKQELLNIGAYYQYGLRGIEAQEKAAMQWYETIAKLNIPEAFICMGDMYMNREGDFFSHHKAHAMYTKAAQAGHTAAFTRLGDLALVMGFDNEAEKNAASKEDMDERKERALILYTFAAKQKDLDAEARLIDMGFPPILEGFIQPQGPCPTKHLGKATIQGKYMHNTTHDGYFGFFIQGHDGKTYDIGIGHDEPAEFMGIKAADTITIPFYKEQSLDTHTGLCTVKLFHDAESELTGSYIK